MGLGPVEISSLALALWDHTDLMAALQQKFPSTPEPELYRAMRGIIYKFLPNSELLSDYVAHSLVSFRKVASAPDFNQQVQDLSAKSSKRTLLKLEILKMIAEKDNYKAK